MKNLQRIPALLALLVYGGGWSTAYGQSFIDSFDTGAFSLTGLSASEASVSVSGSSSEIFGGVREVSLSPETNPFLPHSTLSLNPQDGFMNYDREQNATFTLAYGSYASVVMNADLSPYNTFRFNVPIFQSTRFTVTVRDNTFYQIEATAEWGQSTPGIIDVPFWAFRSGPQGSQGFNQWYAIGGIRIDIAPDVVGINGPGLYQFESITLVPEPAQVGVFAGIASLFLVTFVRLRQSLGQGNYPSQC